MSAESAVSTESAESPARDDWWRDAVVYQIYPRSFADANGDGEGDIAGVIGKLDYLRELGVDAIWLSPFYPSPLADGGYDVADYRAIDPRFGTMEQFDELVAQAHERGIKVIIDIVPNHTSDQHEWFKAALASVPGSPERARYIFHRGKGEHGELPPTNWLSNFGGSAWESCGDGWYYLHTFAKEQPDLNWDNPEVHEEFLGILRFWCGKGVDGFRIDVSHGLAKDLREPLRDRPDPTKQYPQAADGSDPMWDRDAVHDIYREWRELFNQYEPAKYAIGESWTPFNERVFQYAKQDELGAIFDFSLEKADWNRDAYRASIERTWEYAKTAETAPTWVLGNHDVPRIASRLGVPTGTDIEAWVTSNGTNPPIDPASAARRARAAALIMLGLPGTAFVYQGEELGLPEDFDLLPEELQDPIWERRQHAFKGRDGCRVPLPWTGDKDTAFGFNDSGRAWLPQPDWFADYAESSQENHDDSTLNLYRRAVAIRKRMIKHGADIYLEWLPDDVCGPDGFGWTLPSGMTVLTNFSSTRSIALPEHAVVLLESRCSGTVDRILPETTAWYRRA